MLILKDIKRQNKIRDLLNVQMDFTQVLEKVDAKRHSSQCINVQVVYIHPLVQLGVQNQKIKPKQK